MNAETAAFYGLGFAVLLHVIFVTITLGTGWISAFSRYMAYRKSDPYLELFARRAFRILLVFELFSGVWGTIITVFLAGFFPSLTALATNVLFTPLVIAVVAVMVRIPSIGVFWYTWGKIHPKVHSAVGFVMAMSGFAVPLGFRTLFAEITAPTAVAGYIANGYTGAFSAYTNPVFWTLYIHTVLASLSVGGFIVALLMSMDEDSRGVRIGYFYGLSFLIPQMIAGAVYLVTIAAHSPYIFHSITAGNYLPVLIIKIVAVSLLLLMGVAGYSASKRESIRYVKSTALLSLLSVFFGELMNSGARYPYMVVMGDGGILTSSFLNLYIDVPMAAVHVILAFLFVSLAIFLTALFYALFKRYLTDALDD